MDSQRRQTAKLRAAVREQVSNSTGSLQNEYFTTSSRAFKLFACTAHQPSESCELCMLLSFPCTSAKPPAAAARRLRPLCLPPKRRLTRHHTPLAQLDFMRARTDGKRHRLAWQTATAASRDTDLGELLGFQEASWDMSHPGQDAPPALGDVKRCAAPCCAPLGLPVLPWSSVSWFLSPACLQAPALGSLGSLLPCCPAPPPSATHTHTSTPTPTLCAAIFWLWLTPSPTWQPSSLPRALPAQRSRCQRGTGAPSGR